MRRAGSSLDKREIIGFKLREMRSCVSEHTVTCDRKYLHLPITVGELYQRTPSSDSNIDPRARATPFKMSAKGKQTFCHVEQKVLLIAEVL